MKNELLISGMPLILAAVGLARCMRGEARLGSDSFRGGALGHLFGGDDPAIAHGLVVA